MISSISHITLLVHNIDDALAFYTEKLGFDVVMDHSFNGFRWTTVCPKGNPSTQYVLFLAQSDEQKKLVGKQVGDHVFGCLGTQDCKQTYAELKAKGVQFLGEPTEQPWGTEVLLKDLYGNTFDLVQSKPMEIHTS